MTLEELQTLNGWVSGVAAVCGVVFICAYSLLARWWRSGEGLTVMLFAASVTFLSAYTAVAVLVVPDNVFIRYVRVLAVAVIGLLMINFTALLVRAQVRNRNNE